MRSLAWLLLLPLLSACCTAAPTDDAPKSLTDQVVGPAQVIGAYVEAVQAGDREGSLALGTAAWAAREADWRQGFTHAFFEEGVGVQSWQLESINREGDGVSARVRAVLTREGEEPDKEGMLFALTEIDGTWKITSLR